MILKLKHHKNKFFILILFFLSIIINQYYGNLGVFPLDSFIIFDAGHNIISGNHPFKDYWSITGPFLDYLQSIIFLVFGINWFSYVLHGSLINMAITISSFYFFFKIGLNPSYAFIYSLGIAVLAYPSAGTPFMDHHAVIFSVMSMYCLILGIFLKKNIFWFLIPLFLLFSFFSKQIPSAYLVFLFFIIILFHFIKNFNKPNIFFLFCGIIFSLFLICVLFYINEIPLSNFLVQYILYPISLGEDRIGSLNLDFKNSFSQFKFIYISIIPTLVSSFILIRIKNKKNSHINDLIALTIFFVSIFIFIYTQLLTKNQVLIFFLIPICLAFSHVYIIKYFNKKKLIYFILIIFIFTTFKYHFRFNEHRKFMELVNADFNLAINANILDQSLSGLKWISPQYIKNPEKEINLLINSKSYLEKIKENKIIITDYQFFSAVLSNKIASPNKWYDDMSVPKIKNNFYNEYKNFFLNKIRENNVKLIYTIGQDKEGFFQDLINKNDCVDIKKVNEILLEYKISRCDF